MMSGVVKPDTGKILIDGKETEKTHAENLKKKLELKRFTKTPHCAMI